MHDSRKIINVGLGRYADNITCYVIPMGSEVKTIAKILVELIRSFTMSFDTNSV